MRLVIALSVGIVAAVLAAPAFGQDEPNPWPAKKLPVVLYVDTVTASPGESKYGVSYPKRCTQLNLMRRGEGVVFRMWAVDAKTGDVLEDIDVKYAYIKVPGQPNLKMRFTPHGRDANAPWFWAARWDVPPDYPLGVVDFQVIVKTKTNKFGIFRQPDVFGALKLGALEIVESRPVEAAP